jgi:uridine kinase
MIVEGGDLIMGPKCDMFDVKIYVHADSDERLIRRMKRDIAERGRIWTDVGIKTH